MTRGPQIAGFDYLAGKAVSMTAAEWRTRYPPGEYTRATAKDVHGNPVTWYRWHNRGQGVHRRFLSAEAYATIPAGKEKAHGCG